MRGQVTGTKAGRQVEVWFEDGDNAAAKSDSFTYTAKSRERRRVLVVAAEDYTASRPRTRRAALPVLLPRRARRERATGRRLRRRRERPQGAEPRRRAQPLRRGRLVHGRRRHHPRAGDGRRHGVAPGQRRDAGHAPVHRRREAACSTRARTRASSTRTGYEFDLERNSRATPTRPADGCEALSDDFLQYYLGAYIYNDDAGTKANGQLYDVLGVADPFGGLTWSFGGPSANNQDHSASFIATSGILPAQTYPQFESWASAKYVRPGGPFDPATGTYYAYSQIADVAYKRLSRTIDLTGSAERQPVVLDLARHRAGLGLRVRRGAHRRARTTGRRCPTPTGTRARARARTTPIWRAVPRAGSRSCTRGSRATRRTTDDTCTPTGTTRQWNAASGHSAGWEQWSIDLSAYAGKQVEVSIAYASDWSVQGLGVVRRRHRDLHRRRPRSRSASAAGRSPVRRPAAARTRTTGRARPQPGSPRARPVNALGLDLLGLRGRGGSPRLPRGAPSWPPR